MLSQQLKKRYTAFWDNDAIDRCLLYINIIKTDDVSCSRMFGYDDAVISNVAKTPAELEKQWKDLDARVDSEKNTIANTIYYGDGFPTVFANFGPGSLAACIGGNYKLAESTIWFDRDPIIKDYNNLPEIRFDPDSEMCRLTEEFTLKLCQGSGGSYYTSIADLGGTLDIIASLRGSQELLYDLYDYPDQVKDLTKRVNLMFKEAYNRLADIIFKYNDGITSWMPIWCKDRYSPIQCDFSAMISPDMFEEFVLPDLVDLTEFLDKTVYHLDGPGELPHLDLLLGIPRLNAIQWVPGAGNADTTDECWFEMYQKIQAAGKSLVLFTEEPERIEKLLGHISTKGLYIWASNIQDEKLAQELVDMVDKIGVK